VRAPAAASADTLDALQRFLRHMSDSTARRFGAAIAPLDTAGLDSALAAGLAGEAPRGARPRLRPELSPWFQFDRVDGPVMGGVVSIGPASGPGRLSGRAAWASGPDLLLGGGEYFKRWGRPRRADSWSLSAFAGRVTDVLDLDRRRRVFSTVSAFLNGGDRQHYLRRDGLRVWLAREGLLARWRVGWRGQLESPRVTTATWNLTGSEPRVIENLPAAPGRVSEFQLVGSLRPTRWPVWIETDARLGAGGDFAYRRLRASGGADLPLSRWATVLPQVTYGVFGGDLVPQNGYWLGGPSSVRSLRPYAEAGDHLAFGRAELVIARDVAELVGMPGRAWIQLQPVVFAASGAVWGRDPLGAADARGGAWPERTRWRSEIGAGVFYRPGMPDPEGFFRILLARPLGPNDEGTRLSVSYSLPLDQLRFRSE
jgi:hypothetical protein